MTSGALSSFGLGVLVIVVTGFLMGTFLAMVILNVCANVVHTPPYKIARE